MENAKISAASISRVLQGVAVATKAPERLVEALSGLVRQRGQSTATDTVPGGLLTFDQWHETLRQSAKGSREPLWALSQAVLAVSLLREKSRGGLDVSNAELNTIWGLIYQAIDGADGSEIKFGISRSAQGFMAVTLCSLVTDGRIEELWRFHIWLPDGERGLEDVSIHSHQCWGRSWILLGSGTDVIYSSQETDDPRLATHAAYRLHWASADGTQNGTKFMTHQKSSTIRNSGRLLQLTQERKSTHSRDMSYSIPHSTFHESIVPGTRLHATLFVFDSSRGYDANAAVVGPKDGTDYTQVRDAGALTAAGLARMVDTTRCWEQARGKAEEGNDEHPIDLDLYRRSCAVA